MRLGSRGATRPPGSVPAGCSARRRRCASRISARSRGRAFPRCPPIPRCEGRTASSRKVSAAACMPMSGVRTRARGAPPRISPTRRRGTEMRNRGPSSREGRSRPPGNTHVQEAAGTFVHRRAPFPSHAPAREPLYHTPLPPRPGMLKRTADGRHRAAPYGIGTLTHTHEDPVGQQRRLRSAEGLGHARLRHRQHRDDRHASPPPAQHVSLREPPLRPRPAGRSAPPLSPGPSTPPAPRTPPA